MQHRGTVFLCCRICEFPDQKKIALDWDFFCFTSYTLLIKFPDYQKITAYGDCSAKFLHNIIYELCIMVFICFFGGLSLVEYLEVQVDTGLQFPPGQKKSESWNFIIVEQAGSRR